MPHASALCAHVDTGSDQLRGGAVQKLVQVSAHPEIAAHLVEGLDRSIRKPRGDGGVLPGDEVAVVDRVPLRHLFAGQPAAPL